MWCMIYNFTLNIGTVDVQRGFSDNSTGEHKKAKFLG